MEWAFECAGGAAANVRTPAGDPRGAVHGDRSTTRDRGRALARGRHSAGADPGTAAAPAPHSDRRRRTARVRHASTASVLALLLAGCATTGQPLLPDHGYPSDWPALAALSEGLPELEGLYADEGVAATDDGRRVRVRLSELVPRAMPRKDADAEPMGTCDACIAVRVVPRGRGILSSQRLRFTLPRGSTPRVVDVASVGSVNSTLYVRGSRGDNAIVGAAFSGSEVRLTCATDGSLVAQIHDSGTFLLFMVIPVAGHSEYTWARFERHRE